MSVEQIENMMGNLELEDVMCHVCFQVNHEPFRFGTCKHTLCAGCTGRWLGSCPDCPMCRTAVDSVELDEELQEKAAEYLRRHPEQELPNDIKWKQNCYETVFWAIQQRRNFSEEGAVFCGKKPVCPEEMSEDEKKVYLQTVRSENIWKRLDILKGRIGEQTEVLQQIYQQEMRDRYFFNDINISTEEDHEWQIVPGRGLLRVPRSTNRFYCPLRFRRSHSS